ncbi:hypothetical protein FA09DRAFT_70704 [Tilletiopsis washingtonensis]|uniref:Secreted protein n=1 Tax=Tilletiopsis washingtonensis TaxID=58919 RepID=A0A316Z7E7_9BASI|nr:hypothetical protein FA09DRAFT_70704 [Tilletiopsis washingtonensis]PWN96872.1 hypothetical protein FA09DRAFT_70704 [Tilletiopsis washingtonensis]
MRSAAVVLVLWARSLARCLGLLSFRETSGRARLSVLLPASRTTREDHERPQPCDSRLSCARHGTAAHSVRSHVQRTAGQRRPAGASLRALIQSAHARASSQDPSRRASKAPQPERRAAGTRAADARGLRERAPDLSSTAPGVWTHRHAACAWRACRDVSGLRGREESLGGNQKAFAEDGDARDGLLKRAVRPLRNSIHRAGAQTSCTPRPERHDKRRLPCSLKGPGKCLAT